MNKLNLYKLLNEFDDTILETILEYSCAILLDRDIMSKDKKDAL